VARGEHDDTDADQEVAHASSDTAVRQEFRRAV
jgi:hypothetical protein